VKVAKKRGNNEGSITLRKDGRWMARPTIHTPDGIKRPSIYGKTREEARQQLAKIIAERDSGLVFDAKNLTVGEYLDRWLRDSVRDTVRPSTYERQEQLVRLHIKPALGRLKLKSLTPAHVQGLYRDRMDSGLSPATVHKIHVVLHKALSQAVRWSLIPRDAAEAVKAPRPAPDEIRPLNREQVNALLEGVRANRLEALYVLAVTTGMRQGELLGLKWEDVDLNKCVVRIRHTLTRTGSRLRLGEPKTKKSRRTIQLTGRALEALRAHRKRQLEERMVHAGLWEENDLVFATQVGTFINPSNLRRRSFKPLLEKANLPPIRFHDLRHTAATLLLIQGVHPKYVQELLGHATISITLDTYSHILPSMGDQTARAMEAALS
jgi:integrase